MKNFSVLNKVLGLAGVKVRRTKRLPFSAFLRTTKPDEDSPSHKALAHLHVFWENSRGWHLQGEESRNVEHGHLIRALMLSCAVIAGVFDEDVSAGDAEVKNTIQAAESGTDDCSRAGVQMVHARTLLHICQSDADALAYLTRNLPLLKKMALESEAFYQSDKDFFRDLRAQGVTRADIGTPELGVTCY